MNKTTVIIPALLRSDEDDALLQRTLQKVPWRADDELILITQVNRPSGWPHAIAPHVQWKHFENPITKWKAIDVARREVSPAASKVVFLDADDPYTEDSLREAWERIEEGGFELLIGQRKQIALRATDELSPRSRLYLEIFFNALLLVKLGKEFSEDGQYPDIQSGFYVLNRESLQTVRLDHVRAYGGELAIYYQLARRNGMIAQTSIEIHPRLLSSFDMKQIVTDVFRLPFLADVETHQLELARKLAPLMYERYLTPEDRSQYLREIDDILALRGLS